ncbi:MbnP family protein [Ferruginibacter sp.]|nr:hypothetical protein [Ferruginibacter sp.]
MVARPVKILLLFIIILVCTQYSTAQRTSTLRTKTGTIKITFVHTINEAPLVLDSMEYVNPFDEPYRISKLKYYISNIAVKHLKKSFAEPESYHLIDEADAASLSFNFDAPANNYSSISFTIGVDSIKNISGAQSGALDPANGMFWTWNSGYIFFKLEGSSTSSTLINNKIEYHIGGFAAPNNALKRVTLQMPDNTLLLVQAGKTCEIIIAADINKLWQADNNLKIAETPATMTPGAVAIKIANNYSRMFTIKELLTPYSP